VSIRGVYIAREKEAPRSRAKAGCRAGKRPKWPVNGGKAGRWMAIGFVLAVFLLWAGIARDPPNLGLHVASGALCCLIGVSGVLLRASIMMGCKRVDIYVEEKETRREKTVDVSQVARPRQLGETARAPSG